MRKNIKNQGFDIFQRPLDDFALNNRKDNMKVKRIYAIQNMKKFFIQIENNIEENLKWDRTTPLKDFYLTPSKINNLDGVKDINELVSHIGKQNFLWRAFTYRLEFSLDRFKNILAHIDGYSTESSLLRFKFYCDDAIFMKNPEVNKYYKKPAAFETEIKMVGLMRIMMEKAARANGQSFKEFYFNNKGNIRYNEIRKLLDNYFRMIPTGVYWSEAKFRQAEKLQIDNSRYAFFSHILGDKFASLPLNYDKGGGGPPSKVALLPNLSLHLGIGRSIPQILNLFKKIRLVRKNMGLNTFKEIIIDMLGSISNAYDIFTENTIKLIEDAGYLDSYIYELYHHYYSHTRPNFKESILNIPKFIEYTSLGYDLKHIAPLLRMGEKQLSQKVNSFIEENFRTIDSNGKRIWSIPLTSGEAKKFDKPHFKDLQNLLMAPIALYRCFQLKLTNEEIAKRFKHNPYDNDGYQPALITNLFKRIYRMDIESIRFLQSLQEIKDIILHFNPNSLTELSNIFSMTYKTIQRRLKYIIVEKKKNFKSLEQLKISIIGPLLYKLYKIGMTPIQIAKHNNFFWKKNKVLKSNNPHYNKNLKSAINSILYYTNLIFECNPEEVIDNFLTEDDYINKFGVKQFNFQIN